MEDKTGRNEALERLTVPQIRALNGLLTHGSVTRAAREAGRARSTVYRWLADDADFKIALAQERANLVQAMHDRTLLLACKATQTVDQALDGGDVHTGVKILTGLHVI